MSSVRLELAKRNNPGLADLLDELMAYINGQRKIGQAFIVPKLAASFLKLNDGEAFVLLEVLATAGILQRKFNVYCRDKEILLATVDDPRKLDELPYCDFCDRQHLGDELKVEIAYTPTAESNDVQRAA